MAQKKSNIAVLPFTPRQEKLTTVDKQRLDLINVLQTTLDIEVLLTSFSERVKHIVPHSGFLYRNDDLDMELQGGSRKIHACRYELTLEEHDLGSLTLMRQQSFLDNEVESIEAMLGCLIYPLRNAILYKHALASAHTDPLTGTKNRAALDDDLQREWKLARRQQSPLSLIILDIDYFKAVNDNYGHASGDAVLKAVANCLKETARTTDIICRYGGEEFVILLNNTTLDGAVLLADRIRSCIESHTGRSDTCPTPVTVSAGVARLRDGETVEGFFQRADHALYEAKQRGRNQVRCSS